jgi:hypothetical protein
MPPKRLLYYGTEDEMQLGDRIRLRRVLGADELATVTNIPGQSHPDPNILDNQFGFETEDGNRCITDHEPVTGQLWSVVPKDIHLVRRSDADAE